MKFGKRLRELRTIRGYTREDVASRIGVSFSIVEKWESDNRIPSYKAIEKLAVLFGMSAAELGGDTLFSTSSAQADKQNKLILSEKYRRVIAAFERMDESKREELTAKIEAFADLFPKEDHDEKTGQR